MWLQLICVQQCTSAFNCIYIFLESQATVHAFWACASAKSCPTYSTMKIKYISNFSVPKVFLYRRYELFFCRAGRVPIQLKKWFIDSLMLRGLCDSTNLCLRWVLMIGFMFYSWHQRDPDLFFRQRAEVDELSDTRAASSHTSKFYGLAVSL